MKELFAALDLQTIPQVSLGTAALLIFGACASLAVLRGLLRIIVGTLIVCVSGFAALQAWRYAPALLGHGQPWLSVAAPVVTGIVSLLVLRAILKVLVRPWGEPNKEVAGQNRRSPLRWALTLLFSLVPTALLWFSGATALRNFGSVAEIRRFVDGKSDTNASFRFLAEIRRTIGGSLERFGELDSLSDEARVTLAKLIALGESSPPKAIPVMEEPEIRTLILDDPELRQLAREKRYADILRDPRLDHVMRNPNLRELLANLKL
ncbi:HPP family protein [Luteolibacter marinus]|uniref:HPP family protein n=1 Tax=Luteolibacter marinus TaxID=2776705 RepID=UPI0018695EEB|nr:HPP family protein [Luteolibacter marinus]